MAIDVCGADPFAKDPMQGAVNIHWHLVLDEKDNIPDCEMIPTC